MNDNGYPLGGSVMLQPADLFLVVLSMGFIDWRLFLGWVRVCVYVHPCIFFGVFFLLFFFGLWEKLAFLTHSALSPPPSWLYSYLYLLLHGIRDIGTLKSGLVIECRAISGWSWC